MQQGSNMVHSAYFEYWVRQWHTVRRMTTLYVSNVDYWYSLKAVLSLAVPGVPVL